MRMNDDVNNGLQSAATDDKNYGLTLDDLRLRRALALVRLEMHKDFLKQKYQVDKLPHNGSGVINLLSSAKGGGAPKLSYLILGFKMSKLAFSLWNAYNKRKKQK